MPDNVRPTCGNTEPHAAHVIERTAFASSTSPTWMDEPRRCPGSGVPVADNPKCKHGGYVDCGDCYDEEAAKMRAARLPCEHGETGPHSLLTPFWESEVESGPMSCPGPMACVASAFLDSQFSSEKCHGDHCRHPGCCPGVPAQGDDAREVESHTLIRDEYRKAFFAQPQTEQFKMLVRRAVIDVYGSSLTSPESRERVAQAAMDAQAQWDAGLKAAADELDPECCACGDRKSEHDPNGGWCRGSCSESCAFEPVPAALAAHPGDDAQGDRDKHIRDAAFKRGVRAARMDGAAKFRDAAREFADVLDAWRSRARANAGKLKKALALLGMTEFDLDNATSGASRENPHGEELLDMLGIGNVYRADDERPGDDALADEYARFDETFAQRHGRAPTGSEIWTAALRANGSCEACEGVPMWEQTPERIAMLKRIADTTFCREYDTFSGFCPVATCCGEFDHDGGCEPCNDHASLRAMLAEAKEADRG